MRFHCRRPGLAWIIAAAFAGHAAMTAAQRWPEKPVRIVVPFSPGGGADVVGRIVGQKLGEALGQPFVIDNRGGAGGTIGTELVAKSPPDGYTLVISSAATSIVPSFYPKLGYDTVKDLAGIALVVSAPFFVVVNPSLPTQSLQDLVALARARRGQVLYSSSGQGSNTHLGGALFGSLAKIELTHVPYKGGGAALAAVIGGEVAVMFATPELMLAHVRAKRLRPLAVAARERARVLPDVPTATEAGVERYEAAAWYGLSAPAGTPKEIIDRLAAEIARAMAGADMRERFALQGSTLGALSPAEYDRFMRDEIAKWSRIIRETGIRPD